MKVYGLIGEKLSHSLSPKIHQLFYQKLNIKAAYGLFEVQAGSLDAAVKGIRALNISGANVTIPYKVDIMDYLDQVSPEAQRIGAVNTIHHTASRLIGYNTDYFGFGRLLDKFSIQAEGKSAVILGNGGAAKSVAAFLENNGASTVYIITRHPQKAAESGFHRHHILSYEELDKIGKADLLINCTPVGMYPNTHCSPIESSIISNFATVVDLIYNPCQTSLMQYAKQQGIQAYNGLYMLIFQAAAAIEIWNEINIPEHIAESVYIDLIKIIQD